MKKTTNHAYFCSCFWMLSLATAQVLCPLKIVSTSRMNWPIVFEQFGQLSNAIGQFSFYSDRFLALWTQDSIDMDW